LAHDDDPGASARRARHGLLLLAVYVVLYGGFMVATVFTPSWMGSTLGGVNVAILYGLGLIGAALALALLYMRLCRPGDAR
jgi:uncharacterized membrane protein (DUF485 family)